MPWSLSATSSDFRANACERTTAFQLGLLGVTLGQQKVLVGQRLCGKPWARPIFTLYHCTHMPNGWEAAATSQGLTGLPGAQQGPAVWYQHQAVRTHVTRWARAGSGTRAPGPLLAQTTQVALSMLLT